MSEFTKTPTVFQMEATECGAASLSMILAYYGKYIPLEEMRIETGVSRDGIVASSILRGARKFGLEAHGYSYRSEKLKTIPVPCILHWNFNHFVVYEGCKKGFHYLNDPAVGRRKLTWDELEEGFTGVVLTFKPTESFEKSKKPRTSFALIKNRLSGQQMILFQLIYIGILLVFPGLVLPVLSQIFMDDILVNGYKFWLWPVLGFMGGLTLLRAVLKYYRGRVLEKLQNKLSVISGYSFTKHLFRLPVSYFDQRYTGDIVSRMDNNINVNEFLAGDFAETLLNIIVALFFLSAMLLYSWKLTLVGLLNTAVCIAAVAYSSKAIAGYSMKMQIDSNKLSGVICAGLSITDTIKASGAENEYAARVLSYQAKQAVMEQEMNRYQQVIDVFPEAAGQIIDALLLLVGAILVINGELSVGMLLAFNSLYDSFCEPMNALVSFVQKIQTMKADMNRVEDVLNYKQDARYDFDENNTEKYRPDNKLTGKVELENISFGYSRLKHALINGFNFRLNCGESIAFVGASGSGKSTVAKIVSGLYQPWEGCVKFDGHNVTTIDRNVLNASISTVSQNIVLFSGSIRDNIKLWNPLISDDDMIQAAKDAEIHEHIITLPGGYDYLLTEGADNLSGGQRQRIEIARALATNPTVLIMDEATSALDPLVEKDILDNIRRRGCTCVVVAHRLSAFRDCNEIVVMDNGEIIQRGTHNQLMQQGGYYRSLVENESGGKKRE